MDTVVDESFMLAGETELFSICSGSQSYWK